MYYSSSNTFLNGNFSFCRKTKFHFQKDLEALFLFFRLNLWFFLLKIPNLKNDLKQTNFWDVLVKFQVFLIATNSGDCFQMTEQFWWRHDLQDKSIEKNDIRQNDTLECLVVQLPYCSAETFLTNANLWMPFCWVSFHLMSFCWMPFRWVSFC